MREHGGIFKKSVTKMIHIEKGVEEGHRRKAEQFLWSILTLKKSCIA